MQGRGYLKDAAFSRWGVVASLPFFKTFHTKQEMEAPAIQMGAALAQELCYLTAWSVEMAWMGIQSQAPCPLV